MIAQVLVSDPIEFVGSDSRADVLAHFLESIGCDTTGQTHGLDDLRGLDVRTGEGAGCRSVHVLWSLNRTRHRAPRGEATWCQR